MPYENGIAQLIMLHIASGGFRGGLCYFCIFMYNIPTRIFTDLYLKSKRQHFRVFVYKSNLYFFFSYAIAEFRIQELFEPLFKKK
jgi:hypothetical protein